MKLAYVVQRYGPEIRGGSEAHCRSFAHHAAGRGCHVEVFTTCASDYRTWRNEFPAGTFDDSGVTVHRFPVIGERAEDFDELSIRLLEDPQGAPRDMQEAWMRKQGPVVPELVAALEKEHSRFDQVIFVTYLYNSTYSGLPVVPGRAVLHPTAHEEPWIDLAIFDDMFKLPRAFVFLTAEEASLIQKRFRLDQSTPSLVAGVGVQAPGDVDAERGRSRAGVSGRYAVCLGRMDPSKGIDHLVSFFTTYRSRRPTPVDLVFVGEQVGCTVEGPGVRSLGSLDDREKWDVLAGADVMIHPSFYESFAINLLEAWSVGVPAIVNGFCDATTSHCRRSHGGVWYRSYAEFEVCMDRLLMRESLRDRLGEQGMGYVARNYHWDHVVDRYLAFLQRLGDAEGVGVQ